MRCLGWRSFSFLGSLALCISSLDARGGVVVDGIISGRASFSSVSRRVCAQYTHRTSTAVAAAAAAAEIRNVLNTDNITATHTH